MRESFLILCVRVYRAISLLDIYEKIKAVQKHGRAPTRSFAFINMKSEQRWISHYLLSEFIRNDKKLRIAS